MSSFTQLFTRLTRRRPAEVKPVWGKQSPIDLLADTLVKRPQGWAIEPNAIRRSGVAISWRRSLKDSRTALTVTMDGQRFRITAAENKLLKDRVIALLDQQSATG